MTDCNLILGYLDPEAKLAGRLSIRADEAQQAISSKLADPLGLDVEAAAAGVIDVVNNAMAEALRIVSVERGHDARAFSLVAFGGAGPMHAAELATALGIREVIIPPIPGGFSALGLVATDLKRDYVKTHYTALESADPSVVGVVYAEMEVSAREMLRAAKVPESQWVLERAADLRYSRQAYELTVPAQAGSVSADTLSDLAAQFHDKHRLTYGHANLDEAVQLVNLRLTAIGKLESLDLRQTSDGSAAAENCSRAVWFKRTGRIECMIYDRDGIGGGDTIAGPAVIQALDTTIVIPPGWTASPNARGHIIMEAQDGK